MNTREKIIKASHKAGACHIGSALSCVEIIEAIYEIKKPDDIFLFAKATGVAALYCYLYSVNKAAEYLKKYPLPSNKVPGVIWSGGSCGQGLSVAVGMALSKKLRDEKGKIYCLISDGELQEGQILEAINFAVHHELKNLIIIVDYNGFQALGRIQDIGKLPFLDFSVFQIDGHDKIALKNRFKEEHNHSNLISAKTVKGKGVDFMENQNLWHYKNLDAYTYKRAILQVSDKASS